MIKIIIIFCLSFVCSNTVVLADDEPHVGTHVNREYVNDEDSNLSKEMDQKVKELEEKIKNHQHYHHCKNR